MRKVQLTSRMADLSVLIIAGMIGVSVIAFAVIHFWALPLRGISGDYIVPEGGDENSTDTYIIRHYWPHRLVQPEWVSSQPSLLENWSKAEAATRAVVVSVGWLLVTGWLIYRFIKLRKISDDMIPKSGEHFIKISNIIFLCLLAFIFGLTVGHPIGHGGKFLLQSTNQIRAAILAITPVGTPMEQVKTNIAKLHPQSFDIRKWSDDKKREGKEINCQLGHVFSHWNELFAEQVTARWIFDSENHLVDVFVEKKTEMP